MILVTVISVLFVGQMPLNYGGGDLTIGSLVEVVGVPVGILPRPTSFLLTLLRGLTGASS